MALIQRGYAELNQFTEKNDKAVKVEFKYPFARRPLVHIGLVELDDWSGSPIRLKTRVSKVHTHYIEIEFNTWSVSKIWLAKVEWLAIGVSDSAVGAQDSDKDGNLDVIAI